MQPASLAQIQQPLHKDGGPLQDLTSLICAFILLDGCSRNLGSGELAYMPHPGADFWEA
jgi:hypothetical protein